MRTVNKMATTVKLSARQQMDRFPTLENRATDDGGSLQDPKFYTQISLWGLVPPGLFLTTSARRGPGAQARPSQQAQAAGARGAQPWEVEALGRAEGSSLVLLEMGYPQSQVVTLEPRSEDGTEGHREFKLKNTLKCTL